MNLLHINLCRLARQQADGILHSSAPSQAHITRSWLINWVLGNQNSDSHTCTANNLLIKPSGICWGSVHFKCLSNSKWTFLIAYFSYSSSVSSFLLLPLPLCVLLLFFFSVFQDKVFPSSPGCLGTHSINKAGFELTDPAHLPLPPKWTSTAGQCLSCNPICFKWSSFFSVFLLVLRFNLVPFITDSWAESYFERDATKTSSHPMTAEQQPSVLCWTLTYRQVHLPRFLLSTFFPLTLGILISLFLWQVTKCAPAHEIQCTH